MAAISRRTLVYALPALVASRGALSAQAEYPSRPIIIYHGYGAGSGMDINARAMAAELSKLLGQQIIVDMRPGATGSIAATAVARAPADGYSLLATPGSALASFPFLQTVSFDPLRDFAPIGIIAMINTLIVASKQSNIKSIPELIKIARERPGEITYATTGIGSAYHLAAELFAEMAGVKLLHIPYKGGGSAALTDLITGRVDLCWNGSSFLVPSVQAGELVALASAGVDRIDVLPDVPTVAESGVPGYDTSGWQGILAPANTSPAIVEKLNAAIAAALKTDELQRVWRAQGNTVFYETPERFRQRLLADVEKYRSLIGGLDLSIK